MDTFNTATHHHHRGSSVQVQVGQGQNDSASSPTTACSSPSLPAQVPGSDKDFASAAAAVAAAASSTTMRPTTCGPEGIAGTTFTTAAASRPSMEPGLRRPSTCGSAVQPSPAPSIHSINPPSSASSATTLTSSLHPQLLKSRSVAFFIDLKSASLTPIGAPPSHILSPVSVPVSTNFTMYGSTTSVRGRSSSMGASSSSIQPSAPVTLNLVPHFSPLRSSRRPSGPDLASRLAYQMMRVQTRRAHFIHDRRTKLSRRFEQMKYRVLLQRQRDRLNSLKIQARSEYAISAANLRRQLILKRHTDRCGAAVEHAQTVAIIHRLRKYMELRKEFEVNFAHLLKDDAEEPFLLNQSDSMEGIIFKGFEGLGQGFGDPVDILTAFSPDGSLTLGVGGDPQVQGGSVSKYRAANSRRLAIALEALKNRSQLSFNHPEEEEDYEMDDLLLESPKSPVNAATAYSPTAPSSPVKQSSHQQQAITQSYSQQSQRAGSAGTSRGYTLSNSNTVSSGVEDDAFRFSPVADGASDGSHLSSPTGATGVGVNGNTGQRAYPSVSDSLTPTSPFSSEDDRNDFHSRLGDSPKRPSIVDIESEESISSTIRRLQLLPVSLLEEMSETAYLELLELLPPITRFTLRELELTEILGNAQLRHDLFFDPELQFKPNLDGEKGDLKREATDSYWRQVAHEVSNKHLYRLPLLLFEVRSIMLELLPYSPDRKDEIERHLDIRLLAQQMEYGVLNPVGVVHYIAELLKANCAPARDDLVDSMVSECEKGDIVQTLRICFQVLEMMKLDYANHQLHRVRPYVVEHAPDFEWRWFKDQYEAGGIKLDDTTRWIRDSLVRWRREMAAKNATTLASGTSPQPKTASPAQPTIPNVQQLHTTATLHLISQSHLLSVPSSSLALPESLRMDVSRLVQYYNDWQDITIMAVLLILFKQSAGPKCTPDRVRDIKRVLWVLLNDSETSMHHVTLQMCEAAGAVRGTPFEARERDMLAGLVEKTLSPDSKLFEVIRLRVGTVLDKIVRSTPTSSSSANPQPLEKQELARVGLSELEEELSELGERVKRLVQHNWRVFGNVYAVVVETLQRQYEERRKRPREEDDESDSDGGETREEGEGIQSVDKVMRDAIKA